MDGVKKTMTRIIMPNQVGCFRKLKSYYGKDVKTKRYTYKRKHFELTLFIQTMDGVTTLRVKEWHGIFQRILIEKKGSEQDLWQEARVFIEDWNERNKLREELRR